MELHDNAILRVTDDLKIADEEDLGDGEVFIDGNAQVTVGSGISLSGGTTTPGILTVAGNGLLVSGNSAGPGLNATGYTNEGYLTMSPGPEGAELNLRDNARAYVRTLQHRNQAASITIENTAEFHIFEVFEFAEPNLGVATLAGDVGGSERSTHASQNADGVMTITIRDSGVMTVDSAPAGGFWTGFALSGGNNRGDAAGDGGTTTIDVSGSGRFEVQQDLHMTYGLGETAESTLKVTGPDATVNINGDLRMSIDDLAIANMGESYLHSVITGSSHSTINVGGTAFIGEGSLTVELDGYVPTGGESFTLLSATTIDGTAFRNTDFSLAELQDGLTWDLGIDGTSVTLNIMGSAGLACDFNGDGGCDIDDLNALYAGTDGAPALSNEAISTWLGQASAANNPAKADSAHVYVIGDANLDGSVDSTDLGLLLNNFGSDSGQAWGAGNLNDDANIDSTDLGLLLNNFGSASSAAAVPEPAGTNMVLLLLLGLVPFMRRRS